MRRMGVVAVLAAGCGPGTEPLRATVTLEDGPHSVLEKHVDIVLTERAPIRLTCQSTQEPEEVHEVSRTGSGRLSLYGLLAEHAYHCVLGHDGGEPELWSDTLQTASLPAHMPEMVASGDAARSVLATGFLLFNHWRLGPDRPKIHRAIVVDGQGRIRWYSPPLESRTGGVVATWTGEHLLVGGGNGQRPTLLDRSGAPQFSVGQPEDADTYHHDAVWTEDGLIVSLRHTPWNTPDQGVVFGFRVEATDPQTGDVVWSWDLGEDGHPEDWAWVPHDLDPLHANAVLWVDDAWGPAVWISSRATWNLLRIDRITGRLTWRMGWSSDDWQVVDEAGTPLQDTAWFAAQHGPELQGDRLVLFDNGATRPDGLYSRGVGLQLDPAAMTLTPVWEWTEADFHEPFFGNVDGLLQGHHLIATGHCHDCNDNGESRTGFVVEVDAAGEEIYRLAFADWTHSLYRAEFIDGCGFVRACTDDDP